MEVDKVDDITDPNTGEVIVEEDAAHVTISEAMVESIPNRKKTGGKVGRPITSPRTMAATFPEINVVLEKLNSGECFTRMRTSHASSEVWSLFEEIAYTENSEFTGIVRCKMCNFMTRYHGQITGTSHMRRHPCFANSHASDLGGGSGVSQSSSPTPSPTTTLVKRGLNTFTTISTGSGDDLSFISWPLVYEKFHEVKDALTHETVGYLSCKECKALVKRDVRSITGHSCKSKDIARKNVSAIDTSTLLFRMKPKSRATPIWDIFEEIIDPTTNTVLGYVRCKQCRNIIRATDPKSIPAVLRKHIPNCPADSSNTQSSMILSQESESEIDSAVVQIVSYNPLTNSIKASPSSNQLSVSRSINTPPKAIMGPPTTPIITKNMIPQGVSPKIVNAKTDFREKVIQFCYNELVGLEAIASESFKRLAQSLVSLGSQYGRSTLVLPDVSQLQLHMNQHYGQVKDTIRIQLDHEISQNMGGALVCDTQGALCILSAYYINKDWQLVESILSATVSCEDINSFITSTLNDYGLNEEERLAKFTFVSRGGLFDGVNICLPSIAHTVDQLIENTIFEDAMITDLIESCRIICSELKAEIKLDPLTASVAWIYKWELMNTVLINKDNFEMQNSTLDIDLIKSLVDLLTIFKEASIELRQCNRYPTLNHVLLWYHKLLKVLNATSIVSASSTSSTPASTTPITSPSVTVSPSKPEASSSPTSAFNAASINDLEEETPFLGSIKNFLRLGLEQHFNLHSLHKIATFLWPNFRYLKMLSTEERDQVHTQVRNYIETRLSQDEGLTTVAKRARSDFSDWEDNAVDGVDEIEKYVTAMLTSCSESSLLQWWKEHQNDFPKLSRLAKWVLSIPASVTSLEKFKLHATQRVNDELLFLYCNSNKKQRFSSIKKSWVRSSWQEKMKLKAERKAIKEREDKFKARRQQKLEEARRRREEARKRKEENQRKAEVVQPIKSSAKLKRMSKKELRKIRKA